MHGAGRAAGSIALTKNLLSRAHPIPLVATWQGISTSHIALIGNVDWSTNVANDANFPPFLYINGVNRANGTNQAGFRIVSLVNPTSLQQIGSWSNGYAHDSTSHAERGARMEGESSI